MLAPHRGGYSSGGGSVSLNGSAKVRPTDCLSSDLQHRHHSEPHITTSAEKLWRNPIIIT